jgi:hypothetical protein
LLSPVKFKWFGGNLEQQWNIWSNLMFCNKSYPFLHFMFFVNLQISKLGSAWLFWKKMFCDVGLISKIIDILFAKRCSESWTPIKIMANIEIIMKQEIMIKILLQQRLWPTFKSSWNRKQCSGSCSNKDCGQHSNHHETGNNAPDLGPQ